MARQRTLRTIQTTPVVETLPMINGPVVDAIPDRPYGWDIAEIAEDTQAAHNAKVKADAMEAEIARLKAENEAIRRMHAKVASLGLTLKVSEKGALSAYGLGRFPVTLYREQWERLLSMSTEIRSYIEANSHLLKRKGE